jgi:hypothetical protein
MFNDGTPHPRSLAKKNIATAAGEHHHLQTSLQAPHSAGQLEQEMLGDPTQVPKPALKVIQELQGQQAALAATNSSPAMGSCAWALHKPHG